MTRTLAAIDSDLRAARERRQRHNDQLSKDGNMRVIDELLEERLAAAAANVKTKACTTAYVR